MEGEVPTIMQRKEREAQQLSKRFGDGWGEGRRQSKDTLWPDIDNN